MDTLTEDQKWNLEAQKEFTRYRPHWVLRGMAWALMPVMFLTAAPANAYAGLDVMVEGAVTSTSDFEPPKPTRTPKNVQIKKGKVTKNTQKSGLDAIPKSPTKNDFLRNKVLPEPLVPMGGEPSKAENGALRRALESFVNGAPRDDFSGIEKFLKKNPGSVWRVSLLYNMGIVYYRNGYFLKAFDAWETAWAEGKGYTSRFAKIQVDGVFAQLVRMHARVGHSERLQELFTEAGTREFRGSSAQLVALAKEGLDLMKTKPGDAFRCGPFALESVHASLNPSIALPPELTSLKSTRKGTSFLQLLRAAEKARFPLIAARRAPGSEVVIPSVVHWKANHYAALVAKKGNRYMVKDPTFQDTLWVTKQALDEEASGAFLIPSKKLPKGWSNISPDDCKSIWGMGNVGTKDAVETGDDSVECKDDCDDRGMAQFNVQALLVSLTISDTPVYHSTPFGPSVGFQVKYSQKDAHQSQIPDYGNLGLLWTHRWHSYLVETGTTPNTGMEHYMRGGGYRDYDGYDSVSKKFSAHPRTRVVLEYINADTYELHFPDGSKEVYSNPDSVSPALGRRIFLTEIHDANGNKVTLQYTGIKLTGILDALNQQTTITYGHGTDPLLITKVTDPFGRFAEFDYNSNGQLEKITDMIGIESSFAYGTGDFIKSMTTPYGITKFDHEQNGIEAKLIVTHPNGHRERFEYKHSAPGIPANDPDPIPELASYAGFTDRPQEYNGFMQYRNTFYWDRKAMKEGEGDYTKAKIFHWAHQGTSTSTASGVLESEKEPLQARVWYLYEGQAWPLGTGTSEQPIWIAQRVETDAGEVSQITKLEYNDFGKVTKVTDPLNRVTEYTYDSNDIDLLETRQTTGSIDEELASFTYNSAHQPLTATDTSGETTTFTYNTRGQVETMTNAKSEVTTLNYDTDGYLTSIDGPLSGTVDSTTLTYDGYGRVRTVTDSESYTITTDYDALNRPTVITYPDSTTEEITYKHLDPEWTKDRLGRWSRSFYDSMRQLVAVQDAKGQLTQFEYCTCGGLERLTDPAGNITEWHTDVQGRLLEKIYPDGKKDLYTYETLSGRLSTMTDALNQVKTYKYFADGNLHKVLYTNEVNSTADVTFTYDSEYNRLTQMSDGTGNTNYSYYDIDPTPVLGAGRLHEVDGPLANDTISYGYDELGRVDQRQIDGVNNDQTVTYDPLGRVTNVTNNLGAFTYNYVNATGRLDEILYPNNQKTEFTYENNLGDQRLAEIKHLNPSSQILSKHNYAYNDHGQITEWTQENPDDLTNPVKKFTFGYDAIDQLTSAVVTNNSTQAILKRYAYAYDKAGNRTSEQIDSDVTKATVNNLNQATSFASGGALKVKGSLNEAARVKIDGKEVEVSTTNTFEGDVDSSTGSNQFEVEATDFNNNTTTKTYQVTVTDNGTKTLTYDAIGNLLDDGDRTYKWDAESRLIEVSDGADTWEFEYDGQSRRTREIKNSTLNKQWVWQGVSISEERDSLNAVQKRFYVQGVENGIANYFYQTDQLGSIHGVTDNTGAIAARYSYDPWGERTKISGAFGADFGFTGHYQHESGLTFALYRAYDSNKGRWLSRDPIGEMDDFNLYRYVKSNTINRIDLFGLDDLNLLIPGSEEMIFGERGDLGKYFKEEPPPARGAYRRPPRRFTVAGHSAAGRSIQGFVNGVLDLNITPRELADVIRNHPDYEDGMPVHLNVCSVGRDIPGQGVSFAQQLATELGVEVSAPDQNLERSGFQWRTGHLTNESHQILSGGRWRNFTP